MDNGSTARFGFKSLENKAKEKQTGQNVARIFFLSSSFLTRSPGRFMIYSTEI